MFSFKKLCFSLYALHVMFCLEASWDINLKFKPHEIVAQVTRAQQKSSKFEQHGFSTSSLVKSINLRFGLLIYDLQSCPIHKRTSHLCCIHQGKLGKVKKNMLCFTLTGPTYFISQMCVILLNQITPTFVSIKFDMHQTIRETEIFGKHLKLQSIPPIKADSTFASNTYQMIHTSKLKK